MPLITKADLARIAGVGKSAVSNWIEKGTLHGDALVGSGRNTVIDQDKALAQLRLRDAGQMGGNGAATRVFQRAPGPASVTLADHGEGEDVAEAADLQGAVSSDTQERIAQERLKEIERRNRQGDEDEAARRGLYTLTTEATRAMTGIAGQMVRAFDGMVPDMATAIASHFKLDQRDVLHVLQVASLAARERAFATATAKAAAVPEIRDAAAPP